MLKLINLLSGLFGDQLSLLMATVMNKLNRNYNNVNRNTGGGVNWGQNYMKKGWKRNKGRKIIHSRWSGVLEVLKQFVQLMRKCARRKLKSLRIDVFCLCFSPRTWEADRALEWQSSSLRSLTLSFRSVLVALFQPHGEAGLLIRLTVLRTKSGKVKDVVSSSQHTMNQAGTNKINSTGMWRKT